ncbi:MAG TPA: ABC transporter ATP-binding protein [Bryobacteraceae bacterium]|nr:ABC transporter ATP-binding protein [Bryobacteraceae bacterium]
MQIALESLTKRFGRLRALENVTATIAPGQIVAVLGSNGAGKTTLLRCLSAIAAPDSGRILYDGEHFNRGRIDLREKLAFLPDFPIVFSQMTVARHLAMMLGLYRKDGAQLASAATEHLSELDVLAAIDTPVGQLSRGQVYKVALATLLTIDPELWMFDEPFASGMDPGGISYFKLQARLAVQRGRTVLYTTQILEVAEKFCDRVFLLHRGQLRVFDAVANLFVRPGSDGGVLEDVFRQLREEER